MGVELLDREAQCRELLFKKRSRTPARSFTDSHLLRRAARIASGKKFRELTFKEQWAEWLPIMGGASSFNVVLDTTAPAGVTLSLNGGATFSSARPITAAVNTSDTPTTGYQIKIWGSVDLAANASIQDTEAASTWITPGAFPANQSVTLSTGDGLKTINCKVRDDVWNESGVQTQTITLDTTLPVVTIVSGPDVTKISKVATKRLVTFGWQSDSHYQGYEVEVVANAGSARGSGTVIGFANGSTNVSGGAGNATTTVTTTIDGRDLEAASAGDGTKVVKVFVQDDAGTWSA